MAIYTVQCAYVDTDGQIKLTSQDFEAVEKDPALKKAVRFFTAIPPISFCKSDELLFSVPKEISARNVVINGCISGANIATGNGIIAGSNNVVVQKGHYNISLGNASGVHIGDTY